jgi:glycerol kinase
MFFGEGIPIAGTAGDQHVATFVQTCFWPVMAKNTCGTALALMNIGQEPKLSRHDLSTDLGWHINGKMEYALEGVVFIGGAAVQWLRDGLHIRENPEECAQLAEKVPDAGGVCLVPALTGLCAPYRDTHARALIVGISRGTGREHLARASLESMAYQTRDVGDALIADSGEASTSLGVDGGATHSDFLMQLQADVRGIAVERPP